MSKPVTPLCGCDVFVVNDKQEVLLIRRADNGFWALPGGCQNLGETAKQCAERECWEESGITVKAMHLLGVWSSQCYPYENYPWKDNEFTHVVFFAEKIGGSATTSAESTEVAWFPESALPELSDGHRPRIEYGFRWLRDKMVEAHFE